MFRRDYTSRWRVFYAIIYRQTSENRTELLVIENGSVSARLYIREIPILHAQLVDAAAVLFIVLCIVDNTRAHTLEVRIQRVDLPTQSLGLNPIQRLWDILKR